jgi:hypothetical protein
VEVFAAGFGVVIPAGIGMAPPLRRAGVFVRGGRCSYPLRTTEPTGLVRVAPRRLVGVPTLGQLFALWGQPLSARAVAGFRAARGEAVVVFLDGVRWRASPDSVPLRRHAQVVIELGPRVEPHPSYLFPPGL